MNKRSISVDIAVIVIFTMCVITLILFSINRPDNDILDDNKTELNIFEEKGIDDISINQDSNKRSRDWSERDAYYLHIIADLKGGTVEDRAYNIRVTVNRAYDECRSIIDIVSNEIPNGYHYQESEINNDAYNMVIDGWDETNGSLEWR